VEGITDITMSSETSGRITRLFVKLGDKVTRGQKIGEVDNAVLKIRLDSALAAEKSAEVNLANADMALQAGTRLLATQTISQAEYNQNLLAYRSAKASLDAAKANSEAARKAVENSELAAAATGIIADLPISVGETINPGQMIASIVDASSLVIKTGIGESSIRSIRKGLPVIVTYPGLADSLHGIVSAYGIKPLPNSATYPLEISVPNPNLELVPGMVVSASILTKVHHQVLYTSINNIIKEYDRNYVFIVSPNSQAEKREIRLGEMIGPNVIISGGVQAGEMLITGGLENLEPGMKVIVKE
jgi:RND family efflux transporter MFP subunit